MQFHKGQTGGDMILEKVNIKEKLDLFNEHWKPKIIGELNGQLVKIAKLKGEFVWHHHEQEDELFLVIKGHLTIKLRDKDIELDEGEFFIVEKGVEHKPVSDEEARAHPLRLRLREFRRAAVAEGLPRPHAGRRPRL